MEKKNLCYDGRLHRYIRVNIGRKRDYIIFRCMNSKCSHYVPKDRAYGKECECNRCGKMMLLDARAMQLEKPHCVNCIAVRSKTSTKRQTAQIAADKVERERSELKEEEKVQLLADLLKNKNLKDKVGSLRNMVERVSGSEKEEDEDEE